jgi:cAMP phosphodiesterase
VTGLLVRSTATQWAKGSILAVDGGTHLAAIIRVFEEHLPNATSKRLSETSVPTHTKVAAISLSNGTSSPTLSTHSSSRAGYSNSAPEINGNGADSPVSYRDIPKPNMSLSTGPFAGLELPHESAEANAAYFIHNLISTYLITHPHLDHISGFAINTASFQHTSRPKKLAALPSTIDAIKDHIFNDVIWPNLSDEDGGVGFISYSRLSEGGNAALGEGLGQGYLEVCDGLAVKSWGVSHGNCTKRHIHRGSNGGGMQEPYFPQGSPGRSSRSTPSRSQSQGTAVDIKCVIDSTAYFLRDYHTGNEVLIFGDVEPDSLSISPRNAMVWHDAAPKISAGVLTGILIECSYDDSQADEFLFGHLTPRHLIAELQVLCEKVVAIKRSVDALSSRKRKRQSNGLEMYGDPGVQSQQVHNVHQTRQRTRTSSISPSAHTADGSSTPRPRQTKRVSDVSPTTTRFSGDSALDLPPELEDSDDKMDFESRRMRSPPVPISRRSSSHRPLEGLQIIIIHVKDSLKDGPPVGENILAQLQEYEKEAQLGCTFSISKTGTSIWL